MSLLGSSLTWTNCMKLAVEQLSLAGVDINVSVRSEFIYRVRQIKVIPCRVLLISQQQIGIFTRKFTLLFLIYIYV